ncbi:MAG: protein-export chaperone SecB [Thermodesulfovibrionales bacterium]|nr:protein-export chaperone SecB [Thermodesulfovibrionales bacterium]
MELKFKIQKIKLLECHFKINPEFDWANKPVNVSTSIGVQYAKKNKNVRVILSVNSDDKNQPFIFNTVLVGIFDFHEIPKPKELEKIANINCAAILFPYVREIVADLTRRADLPPFHMDPVNFINFYEKLEQSRKKAPQQTIPAEKK